jgi:hypothetical protein
MPLANFTDVVAEQIRDVGKAEEIEFWRGFMHSDRCKSNWCDSAPNPECEPEIHGMLRYMAWSYARHGSPMEVLDIGSGPISIFSNAFHGMTVNLKAADPLADDYEKLWTDEARRLRVTRPVPVPGEELMRHFGKNSFDVTHIRNAIDHAVHPILVVEQMIEITRKDGIIIIHGFEDEALIQQWGGFHQWNMRLVGGELEFEGASRKKYGVMATFADKLRPISWSTKRLVTGKNWASLVAAVV